MSKILKISILLLFLSLFFLPLFIQAQEAQEEIVIEPPIAPEIAKAPPAVIIGRVVQWIMGIVGALAVVMIVIGGLQYIFSGGIERQVQQAKSVITWSIVGLVIAVFAYVIVWVVLRLAGAGE